MPCRSDHMQPNKMETAIGELTLLHREVFDDKPFTPEEWAAAGQLEGVYNQGLSRLTLNKLTKELCNFLKGDLDVTLYSLELQLWWRNHRIEDKKRAQKKIERNNKKKLKKAALAKLTDEEKELLGLK